jgi:hypothetical protein
MKLSHRIRDDNQGENMNPQMGSMPRRVWGKRACFSRHYRFQFLGLFVLLLVFNPQDRLPVRRLLPAGGITFSETRVENNFPAGLTFEVTVVSEAGEIDAVTLVHGLQGDISLTRVPMTVDPGEEVTVSYIWDTSSTTIPPSAPVIYHWEAADSAGNHVNSATGHFDYDDVRFAWQVQENENLAVWWHDRPDALGDRVFSIARNSLDAQASLYQAELAFPVRIIIYNDFEEFAAWHSFVSEFIGGQAFPALGITTQIVSAYGDQESWLQDVIPHEISHLYFYQVTYSPFTSPPSWLNEGIAQYNEQHSHRELLAYAQERILLGELLRLTALTGSFGYTEDEVALAYAEGLSAVFYFVETYGEHGMGALLAAYKTGMNHDEAFQTAIGRSMPDFEQEWLAWLKAPEGMYGTPTPTATLVSLPMPTMMGLPGPTGTPAAQNATSFPATPARATSTPAPVESTGRAIETQPSTPNPQSGGGLCGSMALLALAFAIPVYTRINRRS